MTDLKTEFELMQEDAVAYLDAYFKQRKTTSNTGNHSLSKNTKRYIPEVHSFDGTLKEFRGFLVLHREFIGCKMVESSCHRNTFELYNYYARERYHNIMATIYDKVSEEDVWDMLQTNIKIAFREKMDPCIYSSPFDKAKDMKTGIYLSREREIIIDSMILTRSGINWKDVIQEYSSIGVNKDICERQIHISYTNTNVDSGRLCKSFNVITVSIPIVLYGRSREDMIKYISLHRPEFDDVVIRSIEKSKRFRNSRLSMNHFQLDSLIMTTSNELVYKFDIKKELRCTKK